MLLHLALLHLGLPYLHLGAPLLILLPLLTLMIKMKPEMGPTKMMHQRQQQSDKGVEEQGASLKHRIMSLLGVQWMRLSMCSTHSFLGLPMGLLIHLIAVPCWHFLNSCGRMP